MDTAPATPDISFRSVARRVDGRDLLADIGLDVARGERVALIGPSGAGKTTLLRMCAGILWPTTGSVSVLGMETGTLQGRRLCQLRRQVGFLHQSDNLVPGLRVVHNVLMGRLGGWSNWRALLSLLWPRDLDSVRAVLDRVELGHRMWAMPGELSGGEQQRVAIARLLLQQPRIVLADEPVSSLDIRLGRYVVRMLLQCATEQQATLLVSLHTIDLLREGFDRVVALRDGRVAWMGRPADLTRSDLQAVYGAEYRALHLDEVALDGNNA